MKIETIVNPGKDFNILPYLDFLRIFLVRIHQCVLYGDPKEFKPRLIFKSSPGSSQRKGSHTPNSSSLIVPHAMALRGSHL